MTVAYTLEPADLLARDRFTLLGRSRGRRYAASAGAFFLLVVGTVGYSLLTGRWKDSAIKELLSQGLIVIGCILLASFFVLFRRNYYYQHVFTKDSHEAYIPSSVTITPEMVTTEDRSGTSMLRWRAFKGVGQDNRCIFLWAVDASDEMLIIPKRAFINPAEAEEFFRASEMYFNASRTDA